MEIEGQLNPDERRLLIEAIRTASQLYDASAESVFFAKKIAALPSPNSLRSARLHLLRMRCEPAELAAALLPARICGVVLALLPRYLSLKLGEGRA